MRDGDDWHDTAFLTVEKNRGNVMCGFLLRAFASSFIVALGIDAAAAQTADCTGHLPRQEGVTSKLALFSTPRAGPSR
jgi:hypothetical protein